MRTLVLAAAFVLALSGVSAAAPLCTPDTLDGYIGLGAAGCSIGSTTFADFFLGPHDPLATEIAPSAILVTPSVGSGGVRLDFTVGVTATAPDFFDTLFGYSVSSPVIRSSRLLMSNATAMGDGVTTGVTNLCLGAIAADPASCPGTPVPPMVVITDGVVGAVLTDFQSFADASFIGVFTDIAVDGGLAGASSLGTVTNVFSASAVPEPATLLLAGTGLIAVARRARISRRAV